MDKETINAVTKLGNQNYNLGVVTGMQILQLALVKEIQSLDPGQEEEEQVLLAFSEKIELVIEGLKKEYAEKYPDSIEDKK